MATQITESFRASVQAMAIQDAQYGEDLEFAMDTYRKSPNFSAEEKRELAAIVLVAYTFELRRLLTQ